jgi:hypothetical protein
MTGLDPDWNGGILELGSNTNYFHTAVKMMNN